MSQTGLNTNLDFSFRAHETHALQMTSLEQYLEIHNYDPKDADRIILQFQDFLAFIKANMDATQEAEEGIMWMKIYNRLVAANNHVLGFTSSGDYKNLHMNEMQLPSHLDTVRAAFNEAMSLNNDRSPQRSHLVDILREKVKSDAIEASA